jgi:hypothetical protein
MAHSGYVVRVGTAIWLLHASRRQKKNISLARRRVGVYALWLTIHGVIITTYRKIIKSLCSTDLEFLTIKCRPRYLRREFSSIIVTAMKYPPQADNATALKELHWTLCKLETLYPEAAFIVAGGLNKANLRTILPKFYQHIECETWFGSTLDHWYSNSIGFQASRLLRSRGLGYVPHSLW